LGKNFRHRLLECLGLFGVEFLQLGGYSFLDLELGGGLA
jgi:hypothetical protein